MNLEIQKKEMRDSLQEYMNRFIPGMQKIVLWFQQGEEQKALEGMVDVVEGLAWICEAISLTQELYSTPINIEGINEFLIQLNDGLVESDSILMADILEYEIIPIVEEWNKIIMGNIVN